MPLTRRPAHADDATALAKVYAAYDTLEMGQPEIDLAEVEAFLQAEYRRWERDV